VSEEQAPYFANVGEMIKYLRKRNQITIVELAKRMGVSQAYLAEIETGKVKPTKEQIETIRAFVEGSL